MGYAVLYVAFGVVALWLLGEVLFQHKARLRWRLAAFTGFLCVVVGVAMHEVVIVALGAVAFGTGQAFVTLSHRRGFSTGWAVGGRPGTSRRRKTGGRTAGQAGPTLEVSAVEAATAGDAVTPPVDADADDLAATGVMDPVADETAFATFGAYGHAAAPTGDGDDSTQVYSPVPMSDDSGEYPAYTDHSGYGSDPYATGGYGSDAPEPQPATAYGYDIFGGQEGLDDVFAAGAAPGYGGFAGAAQGYDEQAYVPQQGYAQQPYAQDPFAQQPYDADQFGTDQFGTDQPGGDPLGQYLQQPYGQQPGYDPYAAPHGSYAPQQDGGQAPQQQPYGYDTPPEGVWTPSGGHPGEQAHIPQQAPPAHDHETRTPDPYEPYPYG
ncbi:hypothetical protein K7472_15150 [Streptomyces sp. PTM05]|uniref:Uncharacterized protein n=1 Tax=Streptantibioticus parmotrematis TaxID=2873249 RepID=A0ABS7QTF3_9ACTN|nr:hypothetical protein [Streptantibioticus parmotrematis]MBY8886188.1 hypothetical protein [Streptantibioticus parmotrematis]